MCHGWGVFLKLRCSAPWLFASVSPSSLVAEQLVMLESGTATTEEGYALGTIICPNVARQVASIGWRHTAWPLGHHIMNECKSSGPF